jgi:hypothetical protein
MKTYEAVDTYIHTYMDLYIHVFFTSALAGGKCSASRSGLFTPRGKGTRYPLDRRLGGPQSRSGRYGEMKILDVLGKATLILFTLYNYI